jgi:hypothetical protein
VELMKLNRRRIGRGRRHLVAVLLPAVIVAGCGGGSSTQTSKSTTTSTQSSAAQITADRSIAGKALLLLSDFPAGWTQTPREGANQPQLAAEVATCLHVSASQLEESKPTEVESPQFQEVHDNSVENSVTVLPTNAAAAEYVKVFKEAQAPSCLATAVTKLLAADEQKESGKLPAGSSFGAASVEPLSFPAEGDQSIAYRISLPFKTKSVTVTFYLDAILAQAGRGYTSLTFTGVGAPIDATMEESLVKLTVERLRQALAGGSSTSS